MKTKTKEELAKLNYRHQVAFALFCAKQTIHLTELKEAHECVRVVELWLDGKATEEECRVVASAAYGAASAAFADLLPGGARLADTASAAAYGAADAAADAANAAYGAARAAVDAAYATAQAAWAAYAARAAADADAWAAAYGARAAARAAADADASAAAYGAGLDKEAIIKAQNEYFEELLNMDKIFEREILG